MTLRIHRHVAVNYYGFVLYFKQGLAITLVCQLEASGLEKGSKVFMLAVRSGSALFSNMLNVSVMRSRADLPVNNIQLC